LCCAAGQALCAGKACCASDQSCIAAGPNKGTCCPDAFSCGPNCCADNEVCMNAGSGQCCNQGMQCGSSCCGSVTDSGPGHIFTKFCADPSRSLCCEQGQTACNGACCDAGKECKNNQCVLPDNPACGTSKSCVRNGVLDFSLCFDTAFGCSPSGCCDAITPN
jgi:hypothetical protein